MPANINIANLANGALAEQFDIELEKVLDNIADPNTDPKKARKITINITFKPSETRDFSAVSFQTKSALVPVRSVESRIILDKDSSGNVHAAEIRQMGIEDYTKSKSESEPENKKVVNINN